MELNSMGTKMDTETLEKMVSYLCKELSLKAEACSEFHDPICPGVDFENCAKCWERSALMAVKKDD